MFQEKLQERERLNKLYIIYSFFDFEINYACANLRIIYARYAVQNPKRNFVSRNLRIRETQRVITCLTYNFLLLQPVYYLFKIWTIINMDEPQIYNHNLKISAI